MYGFKILLGNFLKGSRDLKGFEILLSWLFESWMIFKDPKFRAATNYVQSVYDPESRPLFPIAEDNNAIELDV